MDQNGDGRMPADVTAAVDPLMLERITKALEASGLPDKPYAEVGGTGLRQYSGVLDEEFLRALRGTRGREIYAEMRDNSPIIGGILLAIEQLLRRVQLYVETDDESPEGLDRAEFVKGCLADMSSSWPDTLSEILTMLPFGWAYLEQVYKIRDGQTSRYNDGRIGWRKWALRSQDTLDRWVFDDDGGVSGMVQTDYYNGKPPVTIPIQKALLFRPKTEKSNPEGRSVLRNAYFPWYWSKRLMEQVGIGVERDLAGLPVMWVPPEILLDSASAELKSIRSRLEKIIQNVRRGSQEGVLMPLVYDNAGRKLYDFSLLTSGGQRQFDIAKLLELFSRWQAMALLADWLLLGHEAVGSFALSDSKTELFATALGGWLESILEVVNRHAIPRLFRLNGWPTDQVPAVKHGDIETADIEKLMGALEKYTKAGGALDDDLEDFIRRASGWPKKPEGLEGSGLLPKQAPAPPPPVGAGVPDHNQDFGPEDNSPPEPEPPPPGEEEPPEPAEGNLKKTLWGGSDL